MSRPIKRRSITRSLTVPEDTQRVTCTLLIYLGDFCFGRRAKSRTSLGQMTLVPATKAGRSGVSVGSLRFFVFRLLYLILPVPISSLFGASGSCWMAGGPRIWVTAGVFGLGMLNASEIDSLP